MAVTTAMIALDVRDVRPIASEDRTFPEGDRLFGTVLDFFSEGLAVLIKSFVIFRLAGPV